MSDEKPWSAGCNEFDGWTWPDGYFDRPEPEANGWIQWKGTDVCMDVRCSCGETGHICGVEFCYFVECPSCHTVYAVNQTVELIPAKRKVCDAASR